MNQRPFFATILDQIFSEILSSTEHSEYEKAQIYTVNALLDGRQAVTSATYKPLGRYAILPGKIFGTANKNPEKWKVLRLLVDDVVIQNMSTQKIDVVPINLLLDQWNKKGIKEISFLEELIRTIKNIVTPYLGVFLTATLIGWLSETLRK